MIKLNLKLGHALLLTDMQARHVNKFSIKCKFKLFTYETFIRGYSLNSFQGFT
jgi:hypothetical protein